jgi:hypothetical protein
MAQRQSGYDRKERDLYETPFWVTTLLLPFIPKNCSIWEPACASGKIVRVVSASYASDLVTDFGVSGQDFLKTTELPLPGINAIVTNPPFNRAAEAFIRHGLKLLEPVGGFMAMLLPVDFDSGKTRRDMFADCEAYSKKLILTSRITWFEPPPGAKKKSPSANHAWFCWDYTSVGNLPTIEYLFREEDDD